MVVMIQLTYLRVLLFYLYQFNSFLLRPVQFFFFIFLRTQRQTSLLYIIIEICCQNYVWRALEADSTAVRTRIWSKRVFRRMDFISSINSELWVSNTLISFIVNDHLHYRDTFNEECNRTTLMTRNTYDLVCCTAFGYVDYWLDLDCVIIWCYLYPDKIRW